MVDNQTGHTLRRLPLSVGFDDTKAQDQTQRKHQPALLHPRVQEELWFFFARVSTAGAASNAMERRQGRVAETRHFLFSCFLLNADSLTTKSDGLQPQRVPVFEQIYLILSPWIRCLAGNPRSTRALTRGCFLPFGVGS
jgi:hypothetical protein